MTNPLHASHYADNALQETVEVLENVRIAKDTYRIRLRCPKIARRVVPGQFLMLRLLGGEAPLLGRPLALYDTALDASGEPIGIDVVYLVIGKMTRLLAQSRAGDELTIWGPLGNGFCPKPAEHLIMVAGGIGQTPFMALAREYLGDRSFGDPARDVPPAKKVTLCYGARGEDYLAGVNEFAALGVEVRVSTDDGSAGHPGFVTDVLANVLDETTDACRIVSCGPEKMMEAVAELAASRDLPCQVSLETPMACGIGICFTCVAKVRDADGEWDYKRTCVEGPVFDAEKIEW
jgi:dihydroorotate dehydrogenase electron transfer subunit